MFLYFNYFRYIFLYFEYYFLLARKNFIIEKKAKVKKKFKTFIELLYKNIANL